MVFGLDSRWLDSQWLYVGLIGLIVVERCGELVLTRRNARRLTERGGRAVGDAHYGWMVVVHATFLAACPIEVICLDRPFVPALGGAMLVVLAATMALRYWAVTSLGDRWTTRVFVVPGEPPVTRGPYRFLRHPNYLAVVFEIAALPLVHTAWLTAAVYSVANALVLRTRIRVEEEALDRYSAPQDPTP